MAELQDLALQVQGLATSNEALTAEIIGLKALLSQSVATATQKATDASSSASSASSYKSSAASSATTATNAAALATQISGITTINQAIDTALAASPLIANGGKSKVFSTVTEMKASTLTFNVGDVIVAIKYNSTTPANCPYNVISSAEYTATYGRSPDGYLDHVLKNGLIAVLIATAGEISAIQCGCVASKLVDDRLPLNAFFNYGYSRGILRLNSGHTFGIGSQISVDNNSSKTGTTLNFHVKAHGAKIFKLQFTGSAFLSVTHNPTNLWRPDLWKHDFWTFTWEGGDMDANGFNQHFRWAANTRDGKGTVDKKWFTTAEQQARAETQKSLTAKVFGNPAYEWMINPLSSNTPTSGQDGAWITITGASICTFRDVITRHRNEEGLLARSCTIMTFDNCHDYVSLPTNDQFQIYVAADGNFTNGQQHFHIRNLNSITTATLEVTDGSVFAVGNWVSPHPAGTNVTRAQISSISGNTLFLFDVTFGDGFRVGDTIAKATSIDASYSSTGKTVTRWNVNSRPEMNVSNCSSTTGNSGIGFLDVDRCSLYSTLNINNYTAIDQCLIGIRAEHVHYLNLGTFNIAMSNVMSDPTGTLSYWTNEGIEIGAATRVSTITTGNLINCCIRGANESRQQSQKISSVDVLFLGGVPPIDMKTGTHLTTDGIHARFSIINNCKVKSEKIIGGTDYPLSRGIYSHRGQVTDCEVEGANLGVCGAEHVSGGSIKKISDYAISELWLEGAERPAMVSDVLISDVGRVIYLPDGYDNYRNSIAKISNCIIRNVQKEVITNNSPDLSIELIGNTFIDWGLDTSSSTRGLLDYTSGGVQAREIYLTANSFRATVTNASKFLGNINGLNEVLVERMNTIYPYDGNFYFSGGGAKNLVSDRASNKTDITRITDDIGVEVKTLAGSSLGFVKFSQYESRYYFKGGATAYGGVSLVGGFNVESVTLSGLDFVQFECTLPSAVYATGRSFLGGSSTYCAITSSNKVSISSNLALTIDGNAVANNDTIGVYLDDKNHVIKISLKDSTVTANVRLLLASNSGQETVNFPVWNLRVFRSNLTYLYPMNEGTGRVLNDKNGSGQTAYIFYGSDENWGVAWSDS